MDDMISRQDAIDALKIFTKDCHPEHFVGHSNFSEYMGTVGIRSFGNWQYANGFNMGLTAAEVAIEKLPSAQRKGKWIATQEWGGRNYSCSCCKFSFIVDTCMLEPMWNFCPNCGAMMEGSANE